MTVEPTQAPIGQAYKVTIDWIDEYTTRKQWDEIYEQYIQPRQNLLWEKRGELPHSNQVELDALKKPWLIELYQFMADERMAGYRCCPDKALYLMGEAEKLPAECVDRAIIYRNVKTLDILCKPQD